MAKGIDLCCQQEAVDWQKVKAAGIDFAIPRCGWGVNCDGEGADPSFFVFVKNSQAAGVKIPGVYHFIYVDSIEDAQKNAECAVNAVRKAGLPKSTIIWCDQEEDTVIQAVKHGYNLTTDLQRKVTEIFCDYVLSQGYCTGVYLNQDYINRVYGKDIIQKYDIWFADPSGSYDQPCLIKQTDWWGRINGISVNVDLDDWIGTYTAGTAKPKASGQISLVDKFCDELQKMSRQCIPYYGEGSGGIGCSEYVRRGLYAAGIIKDGESFWAGQSQRGVLEDKSRFQKIPWNPNSLKKADILWSQGFHVSVWDGQNGVWEGAPVATHGVCDNGKTGVGHRSNHTYYNCGRGTMSWDNIYRIIDPEDIKHDVEVVMDKLFNAKALAKYLPVIRSGYKGDICKGLQEIMQHYGWYAGEIDGSCGPLTVAGIKNLQTALGVDADGSFGPKSWTALLD